MSSVEAIVATSRVIPECMKLISEHISEIVESAKETLDYNYKYKKHTGGDLKAAKEVLKELGWGITPSVSVNLVFKIASIDNALSIGQRKELAKRYFVEFYSQNNWENLLWIVSRWDGGIYIKRETIIESCLLAVGILEGNDVQINPVDIVLPTLISQLEGILRDLLIKLGIANKSHYGGKLSSLYKQISDVDYLEHIEDTVATLLTDQLFLSEEKLECAMDLNRNTILHGKNVEYGSKENLIQIILLLDFLIATDNFLS